MSTTVKIAVVPEHRRQGFAQRLMASAEAHAVANGGETLTLEVRPPKPNTRALVRRDEREAGRCPGMHAAALEADGAGTGALADGAHAGSVEVVGRSRTGSTPRNSAKEVNRFMPSE